MKLLNQAAKLAYSGNKKKNHLLAAIAVRTDGAVVSSRNGITKTPKPSVHAEHRALKKAGLGSTLYVAKVLKDGTWAMSKPCRNCMTYIINKRVKRVYYTIGPGEYGVLEL